MNNTTDKRIHTRFAHFARVSGLLFFLLFSFSSGYSQSVTRADFLKMAENQKRDLFRLGNWEILDLVNGSEQEMEKAGSVLLSLDEFKQAPAGKRIHMLEHPEIYKVMPQSWRRPKIAITESELAIMASEKRENIVKDTLRFEIIKK